MQLGGWHKTTLLDFPGKVASLVFTQGCNFHCPYCHNPQLVRGEATPLQPESVLATLQQRRRLLQGVVISGGEPTLQDDLADFIRQIRLLGLAVKLDTNGSQPQVLERLLAASLLDYVAMDIKSMPGGYPEELCPAPHNAAIPESLALLRASDVSHEFRMTCVSPFITESNFLPILAHLPKNSPIFLQQARLDTGVLNPAYMADTGRPLPVVTLGALEAYGKTAGYDCRLR